MIRVQPAFDVGANRFRLMTDPAPEKSNRIHGPTVAPDTEASQAIDRLFCYGFTTQKGGVRYDRNC